MTLSRDMSQARFVLATDLDGTFLGGTKDDRRRLYDWIEANRETVGLVFVSGRDPAFIHELCGSGEAPWPEYVIGDVGTTIARVLPERLIEPIPALEDAIATTWDDRGDKVRAALDGHPGLTLQDTPFRYRVSYHMNPETFDPSATDKVNALGADTLISDNRYFDVLPKGVSKGPSLMRLIEHLEVPAGRVLAAGDTLNDLSMLVADTPAVAVGGSEEPLLRELNGHPGVYHASAIGAAGILEAIAALDLHPVHRKE
ncbi:HAD-IIB family hydrolase [Oceanibium sediminis]|uniref:HAD-IIB family hydrolase n=1 Tax=Oceanibium sediminis TaxID=2026339 RepID=UPI000DD305D1|nr:HAD-IIB family hydrolase [Oceanibium sediminis]